MELSVAAGRGLAYGLLGALAGAGAALAGGLDPISAILAALPASLAVCALGWRMHTSARSGGEKTDRRPA